MKTITMYKVTYNTFNETSNKLFETKEQALGFAKGWETAWTYEQTYTLNGVITVEETLIERH